MMQLTYADLAQLKREIKETTVKAEEDEFLMSALRFTTSRIREHLRYSFLPSNEERLLNVPPPYAESPVLLFLDRPLLSITSVQDEDGNAMTEWDKTVANRDDSDFVAVPINDFPKWRLRRTDGETWNQQGSADVFGDAFFAQIYVDGIWGYHSDYDNAWQDSTDTVQDNPLAAAATTLTVSDADGSDLLGSTPRFSRGQLLRIEDEYLYVTQIDTSANSLTVLRGVNGTTAASHNQNTRIDVWQTDYPIIRAVTKWAAYLYNRRGSYKRTTFDGLGVTDFPEDMPEEIQGIISHYPRNVSPAPVDDFEDW